MLGNGAPHDRPHWTWSCHVHGRPQGGDDRGSATDLADAKAKFKAAWVRIRSGLTEAEIAHARRVAEISAEAVARYDRKGRA
jgi:Xaa-Pro aminopeptidase